MRTKQKHQMNNYYDTVVLSGGSVKSICMLGALQYCYDNKLIDHVKTFIGTSAGAMISYLIVIGYSPTEIIVYLCTNNIFEDVEYLDILSMVNGNGAISFVKFQAHLEKLTIDKVGRLLTFHDLYVKFGRNLIVTTYNYTEKRMEYLSYRTTPTMPCIVALRMTACLPLIFDMFKYMDCYYIDGGIADNFPINFYECDHPQTTTTPLRGADEPGDTPLMLGRESRRLGILIDMTDDQPEDVPSSVLDYIYKVLAIPMEQHTQAIIAVAAPSVDVIRIRNTTNLLNYTLACREKLDMFSQGYKIANAFFIDDDSVVEPVDE